MNLEGTGSGNGSPREQAGERVHQEQAAVSVPKSAIQTLGQQLLNEPRRLAPSATRTAISRLRASPARQQQARDVRAGDRQNQPDGDEQHGEEDADCGRLPNCSVEPTGAKS